MGTFDVRTVAAAMSPTADGERDMWWGEDPVVGVGMGLSFVIAGLSLSGSCVMTCNATCTI